MLTKRKKIKARARATLGKAVRTAFAAALVLGLAPSLGLQPAHAANSVELTTGSQNHYAGGVTRSIYCDGNVAYCMDPANATPTPGTYEYTFELSPANPANVSTLKAALWFSFGSPGFDKSIWPSKWYDGSDMTDSNYYALSHILLSQLWESSEQHALSGTSQEFRNWAYENVLGWKNGEFLYPDSTRGKVEAREGEVPASFNVFVVEPARSGDQNVLSFFYEPNGTAKLTKTSANPSLSDGNSCYSLEGAVYGVYSDAACTKLSAKITTGADGTGQVEVAAGKYWVKEIAAPKGYALDDDVYPVTIEAGKTASIECQDIPQNDPVRILLGKFDGNRVYNGANNIAQAGAPSVEGAEFTFSYYDGQYSTAAEAMASGAPTRIWVFKTNANGFINPISSQPIGGDALYSNSKGSVVFPIGTYLIQETKAPVGYVADKTIFVKNILSTGENMEVVNSYNMPEVPNAIIRGGVSLVKVDSATDGTPLGAATLAGTEFAIRNLNDQEANVGGVWYGKGEVVATLTADEKGAAATAADLLPYGTWSIEETAPGTGMVFGGKQAQTFKIEENGQVVSLASDGTAIKFANDTIRGDLMMVKVREGDLKRLSNIPFRITSNTTGESHVIVTDENGEARTGNYYNAHAYKTNANDAAVSDDGTVDVSKLDPKAGVWFGKTKDGGMAPVTDRGALPYDTYTIEELRAENNKYLELLKFEDVTISRDNYEVALGTVIDSGQKRAAISTTARDARTLSHVATASVDTVITDQCDMVNLTEGQAYVLKATLMDKATGEPVTVAGAPVSAEKAFTATGQTMTVAVDLPFDALSITAAGVVVFEELYIPGQNAPVAEHKDISDAGQTVLMSYPKVSTTATSEDGTHKTAPDPATKLTDTVAYANLVPGQAYTLTTQLVNTDGNAIVGVDGAPVTQQATFTPDTASGTVDVTVEFDTSKMEGDSQKVVFFETISIEGRIVAEHKDPSDAGQTIEVVRPEVGTELTDGTDHEVVATENVKLTDTVAYKGLVADGREYTVTGKLMYKKASAPEAEQAQPYLDADGKEVTAVATFVPEKANGTVDVTFEFNGVNMAAGDALVAFEELSRNGIVLAVHADIDDAAQTVTVAVPEIGTQVSSAVVPADDQASVTDKVAYKNLVPGTSHTLFGIVIDKHTRMPLVTGDDPVDQRELAELWTALKAALKSGEAYPAAFDKAAYDAALAAHPELAKRLVVSEQAFTPKQSEGEVGVSFSFDASAWADSMLPQGCVVFEYLFRDDKAIASHEDPSDEGQSFDISIVTLSTQASDSTDGDQTLAESKQAKIIDKVAYAGLVPGKAYTVKGTLMDKATGKPLMVGDKEVTGEARFTPNSANGFVEVEFSFDSTGLDGKDLVVFETLYKDGTDKPVAAHEDLDDKDQTIHVSKLAVPWGRPFAKTGDLLRILGPAALLAGAAALVAVRASRKRPKAEGPSSEFMVAGSPAEE